MKKLFPLIALMCIFVLQGCPTPGPEPETDTLTAIKSEYTIEDKSCMESQERCFMAHRNKPHQSGHYRDCQSSCSGE